MQWRLNKALIDMTIDRDDWKASDTRQRDRAELYKSGYYELEREIKEIKQTALAASIKYEHSSLDSSKAPENRTLIEAPPRQSTRTPTSGRVSRKRGKTPRTPSALSHHDTGTGRAGPTTPGPKSSEADQKKGGSNA